MEEHTLEVLLVDFRPHVVSDYLGQLRTAPSLLNPHSMSLLVLLVLLMRYVGTWMTCIMLSLTSMA